MYIDTQCVHKTNCSNADIKGNANSNNKRKYILIFNAHL